MSHDDATAAIEHNMALRVETPEFQHDLLTLGAQLVRKRLNGRRLASRCEPLVDGQTHIFDINRHGRMLGGPTHAVATPEGLYPPGFDHHAPRSPLA